MTALGSSNICNLEESLINAKAISWNSNTGKATVKDAFHDTHKGRVRLVTPHSFSESSSGEKINIFVKHDSADTDASEYLIFPVAKNEHRVIGVGYVSRDGKYHLDRFLGNNAASCIQM